MTRADPTSWRPKLVALDVDGTVVDHAARLPLEVIEAVARVQAAGVPVVLATGRAWHETLPIFTDLGLGSGPVVCSNGAVIVDYPPERIVKAITFDPREVITQVLEHSPRTLVAVEEIGRGFRLTQPFPDGDLTGELIISSPEELMATPVTRVIMRDPQSTDEDFLALAEHLGFGGHTYYIGWSAWLDITAEGVNKAAALADVAADIGIDQADVLAMGDGRNDVEMLAWAGRGVAIGDAPDDVRVVADAVTGRFDEGGTVAELDRWF